MKRFFITGTDTDCGKTYVVCQLVKYYQKLGKRTVALKPVASGCRTENNELINEDTEKIIRCNDGIQKNITPWRFKEPISPHIAAEQEGVQLTVQAIKNFCESDEFANQDVLLIEGAGGLMVPLNRHETWLDFLIATQIPVILVVAMRLGCLNHALLTNYMLQSHQIPYIGWMANCLDKEMLALEENIKTLSLKMSAPLLARINFEGGITNFAV